MTASATRPAAPARFDRRLTLPLILGSVLNPVNSTMLAVALVPIGAALGEPPSRTAWLVSALYLTTAIGQPVVGRLVDLFGPRRLYLLATALVGVAGMIGATAQSLDWLIVSRVVLGLGTCSAFPAAMYLLRSEAVRTGEDAPTWVLTALSVGNQTIAVVGPTLGGVLIGLGGWRLIFTINVPLSLACLVLGWLRLPRVTPTGPPGDDRTGDETDVRAGSPSRLRALDLPGIALFTAALLSMMGFLMLPTTGHLWFLVVSVLTGALLVRRELRVTAPFLDLRVLGHSRPLVATYVRQGLAGVVSYAFLYGFVQWLEQGRGLSASHAGLLLLPMSGTAVVASLVVGRRRELWGKLVVGSVAVTVASAGILLVDGATPIWLLALLTLCVGISQGTTNLANQNALYAQGDPERMGSAAGLLRTAMYLGAILAAAAVAGFFGERADTVGLHELGVFMLVCSVVLLALVLVDPSVRRGSAVRPADPTSTPTPTPTQEER